MSEGPVKPWRITIHCSATANGVEVPVERIRHWHTDPPPRGRGWNDIGYHWVVQPCGRVDPGRPLLEEGAHVEGANEGNIGICMIGREHFTRAQFEALRGKIDELRGEFEIPLLQLYCHYEFPSAKKQGKTCPNMAIEDILRWYYHENEDAIARYLLEDRLGK